MAVAAFGAVSPPPIAANYGDVQPPEEDLISAYFDGPSPSGEDWKLSIPLGVRFRPTDGELILNYLQVEYLHGCLPRGVISYASIYEYEPHRLQALAVDHGDGKMYFFTRIRKIGRSKTDRSVKSNNGYWKATQAPKSIKGISGSTIGYKIPLTYVQNRVKTPWLMNEYRLGSPNSQHSSEELVLAVVYHHTRRRNEDDEN